VTIGAPLPVDGRADNLRTGLRINDPNGVERFALYLLENGRIGMGSMRRPEKAMTGIVSASTSSPTRMVEPMSGS
jgi:hypothetical protein